MARSLDRDGCSAVLYAKSPPPQSRDLQLQDFRTRRVPTLRALLCCQLVVREILIHISGTKQFILAIRRAKDLQASFAPDNKLVQKSTIGKKTINEIGFMAGRNGASLPLFK